MFANREEAGRRLAALVARQRIESPIIISIPRGGAVVGHEVARAVHAPLDVMVTARINSPVQPDVEVGMLAPGGVELFEPYIRYMMGVEQEVIGAMRESARRRLQSRVRYFHTTRQAIPLRGRNVVLVDDGIASGLTMRAAAEAVHREGATRIVAAVPVTSADGMKAVHGQVDEVLFLRRPRGFFSIGQWYRAFDPVSDRDVERILEQAREAGLPMRMGAAPRVRFAEPSQSCY